MKRFFICLTAIIAVVACSVSCDKDNTGNRTESERMLILEAVKAASCAVFDEGGVRNGTAIFINPYGNDEARMCAISLNRQMEPDDPLFIKDNGGAPMKINLTNMSTPQVTLGFFVGSITTRKVLFINSLHTEAQSGGPVSTAEWMLDIAQINNPGTLGQDSKALMPLADVEGNLERLGGVLFLRLVESNGMVLLKSIDEVKFTMSDGPEGRAYSLLPVDLTPNM